MLIVERYYVENLSRLNSSGVPQALINLPKPLRVFLRHDFPPRMDELKRPAPVQMEENEAAFYRKAGDLNMWYGYNLDYGSSRDLRYTQTRSHYCELLKHAGWTKASDRSPLEFHPFCVYFARGCCFKGSDCGFHHRLPTLYENDIMPIWMDVFGRKRPTAQHRENSGVGSFNNSNQQIYLYGFPAAKEFLSDIKHEKYVREICGVYGPVQTVTNLTRRSAILVQFAYRAACEFAFEALDGRELTLENYKFTLTVKWPLADEDLRRRSLEESQDRYSKVKELLSQTAN